MILRRFDPLSCSLKSVHASMNMLFLMNKTKDQISRVSSHDLYWENKMYKRKRSIDDDRSAKKEILRLACYLFNTVSYLAKHACILKATGYKISFE